MAVFEPGQIHPIELEAEMRASYMDYAMSVIISRALPDIRDGLKPAQRRILWAMLDTGMTAGARYQKCAAVVGEVLGKYHPHGDSAVYDTLVRLAQPWVMRYPLIDGQGNFGSVDGDPPAAYRYTEARMTAVAMSLVDDIEKDTVDFGPNFANVPGVREPSVMPSLLPNLLVNGASGIAVGMATNIPPHNLGEICDAVIRLIDDRGHHHRGSHPDRQGARLPHRRDHLHTRHRQRVRHRSRTDRDARAGRLRGVEVGARADHRPRAALPGEQVPSDADHRRARQRPQDRGHRRPARRVGARGQGAHRHRVEVECAAAHGAQQPLQAHPAADDLRRADARHRRRTPAGAEPQGDAPALHQPPAQRGHAAHAPRAAPPLASGRTSSKA